MSSFIERVTSFFHSQFSSFSGKPAKIIFLGLDAAGKTTFLYKIKSSFNEVITVIPTIGFNVEILKFKKSEFTCWDVGGCDKIRPLWRHYTDGDANN